MLMQGVEASPYTPSPSPVSPSVTGSSSLPHLQRFQPQQQDAVGFYSTSSFSSGHNNNQSNFMIDCANSVLYNMETSGGGGWDHAADLTTVATDALPQLMEQDQPPDQLDHHQLQQSSPVLLKPVKVKKSRPSRAKKANDNNESSAGDVKRRKTMTGKKCSKRSDEMDDVLMMAKGSNSGSQFVSAMNLTASTTRHFLMLNPKRNGVGLYWNLVRDKLVSPPQIVPSSMATSSSTSQRQKSRVRIGKDHQCAALPRCKKKEANKERESAVLCWTNSGQVTEQQIGRLLSWSRSPALPGPKRTEDEVLAVVTHFHGDIQAAKLHLLTQPANPGHHVLNNWTPEEMAVFHAALLQHGKDFPQVAQHVL